MQKSTWNCLTGWLRVISTQREIFELIDNASNRFLLRRNNDLLAVYKGNWPAGLPPANSPISIKSGRHFERSEKSFELIQAFYRIRQTNPLSVSVFVLPGSPFLKLSR
jgi:hypothetical protein